MLSSFAKDLCLLKLSIIITAIDLLYRTKVLKIQKGGRKMTQNTDEQLQRENERESMVNVIEREEVYENTYKFNVVKDPSFGHYVYVNAIGIEERTQQDRSLYNIDNRNYVC